MMSTPRRIFIPGLSHVLLFFVSCLPKLTVYFQFKPEQPPRGAQLIIRATITAHHYDLIKILLKTGTFSEHKEYKMKRILLTTITGEDREETLHGLANTTRGLGGEWLVTRIIKLDGFFAALMRLTIDEEKLEQLKNQLQDQFPGYTFSYQAIQTESSTNRTYATLELDFLDRPGLTRDISEMLIDQGVEIEQLESTRHPLGAVASTVFSTRVRLALPKGMTIEEVSEKISALENDVQVKIVA